MNLSVQPYDVSVLAGSYIESCILSMSQTAAISYISTKKKQYTFKIYAFKFELKDLYDNLKKHVHNTHRQQQNKMTTPTKHLQRFIVPTIRWDSSALRFVAV